MANIYDQFVSPQGTRLYSPNPDAPTSYGAPDTNGLVAPPQPAAPQENIYAKFIAPKVPSRSVGERVSRFMTAIPQGINTGLYQGVTFPLDVSGMIARAVGLVPKNTPLPSEQIQNAGAQTRNDLGITYTPNITPETTGERAALATGEAIGNVASTAIPGGLLAKTAAPAVAGFRTAIPTYGQTVGEALSAKPVAQAGFTAAGNIVNKETDNPYLGTATSLLSPLILHGAQRTFSAGLPETTQEATRRDLLEFGRQNNLGPLTAGKILDSKGLQTLESAASNSPIPYVGGRVAKTEAAGRNAFQRAALKKAGVTGQTAVTPDILKSNAQRIGSMFDAFKDQTIKIDPQFGDDLAKAKADFSKQLESQMPESVRSKIDELAKAPAAATPGNQPGETLPVPSGTPQTSAYLDGETFQNIRSKLSAMLPRLSGTDRRAVGATIDALDNMAERSLPSDVVDEYRLARQQWRNNLALGKSVSANNADTAVGNMSTAAFGRASRDNPDLAKLGQYGNAFVGDKVANTSRTAGHNVANHMMGLGGLYGAFAGLRELGLNPLYAGAAVGSVALPPIVETALNNPATRAALLARYRAATPSFVKPSLVGSTLLDALKNVGGGG